MKLQINFTRYFNQKISWPLLSFSLLSIVQAGVLNKTTLFLFIIYILILNSESIISIIQGSLRAYWLVLMVAWEVCSVFWSKAPITTLIIVGNDLELLLFSALIAYHSRNSDIAKSLNLMSAIVVTSVLLYCIVFPGKSMTPIGLQSFYGHKNNLGFAMGLCSLIMIMTFRNQLSNYLLLLSSISLLILSESKTSINLLLIIVILVWFLRGLKMACQQLTPYTQGFIRMILGIIPYILYVGVLAIVAFKEWIADYLIASIPYEAFTGRGLLWVTVLSRTRDDLLAGIGPGVFWGADRFSEIAQTPLYEQPWVKKLTAADGGYIDIIGALGFVGLALLLCSIIQAYQLVIKDKLLDARMLILSLITFFAMHNVTETDTFRFGDITIFIFEFLVFYMIFRNSKKKVGPSRINKLDKKNFHSQVNTNASEQ